MVYNKCNNKNTIMNVKVSAMSVAVSPHILTLRSGSTIANEVYPRRGYC